MPLISRLRCLLLAPVAFALVVSAAPSGAVEKRLPSSRQEIRLSYAPLVKMAAPAVVNIYTKRVVQSSQSPFSNDPFFRRFFGDDLFGVPRRRVQNSLGSGVIVRPEGIIVTNNHVIDKADQITVALSDRRELDATVILADEKTDLAVLRVKTGGEPLPYLMLHDSDDLEVGDLVLAIGNPFGVGQTVTSGIVSALARVAEGVSDFSFFIQTDAAINPGNSGGALIAMDGRLVGVNTAIFSNNGGSMGIGFAIPSNMVARVVEGALHGSKVVRPWFGASGQAITAELAASLGMKRPIGILISDVYPGGPAARAGLRTGDVVVAFNDREVAAPEALNFRIATRGVGGNAALSVLRRGRTLTLRLPLEAPPDKPARDVAKLKGRHPLDGATVANLSPALAEEVSLDPMLRGVIVLSVEQRSVAHRLGLRPGDILIRLNDRNIETVAKLRAMLGGNDHRWTLQVRRDGELLSVTVEG